MQYEKVQAIDFFGAAPTQFILRRCGVVRS
jgi:hypothetical protein